MKTEKNRVLITGAAGFLGSHLCDRFMAEGFEVIGMDNFSGYYNVHLKRQNANQLRSFGIPMIEQDICVDFLVTILPRDFDYVFHCAAQPGISSTSTFEDYLNNNIIATHHLTDFAIQYFEDLLKKFGKGKVVVFGEAAMFSAQLGGPDKIKFGMNNDIAPENFQLLLNIIHWLDGKLQ